MKCLQIRLEQLDTKLMQKSPYKTAQKLFGSPQKVSTTQPGSGQLAIISVDDMFSQWESPKKHTGTAFHTGGCLLVNVSMVKSVSLETN